MNYPDRDEAEWFLTALDPNGDRFTFKTFDDNYDRDDGDLKRILHGTLARHWDELVALNERGASICVTVNVTDLKGGAISNIISIRAVFTDLDGAPLEPVLNCPTQPHIITETSPQRWHAYWLVTNGELNEFSNLQKALIAHFDGDKIIRDLPRALRVPGFIHRKGTPFFSRIHTINYMPPHEWEALKKAFPPAEPEKPQTGEELLEARNRGDEMFSELLDDINRDENDPAALAYNIWVGLSRYLADAGWRFDELARDLKHHVHDQNDEHEH